MSLLSVEAAHLTNEQWRQRPDIPTGDPRVKGDSLCVGNLDPNSHSSFQFTKLFCFVSVKVSEEEWRTGPKKSRCIKLQCFPWGDMSVAGQDDWATRPGAIQPEQMPAVIRAAWASPAWRLPAIDYLLRDLPCWGGAREAAGRPGRMAASPPTHSRHTAPANHKCQWQLPQLKFFCCCFLLWHLLSSVPAQGDGRR